MQSYFVAIPLPDESKDCLVAIQPCGIRGMRQIGWDELHLTLHYLGQLSEEFCERGRKALLEIKAPKFTIDIRGVGLFSTQRKPDVLWSAVDANPKLLSIHQAIGTVLTRAIGFRAEQRPYFPHITLARFNQPVSAGTIMPYIRRNRDFFLEGVSISEVALYSSTFVNGVPRYRQEAAFALSDAFSGGGL